jgi:uncharacterized protein (DUF3820 family)
MSNIVPFGKYKGQPIENLAADPEYSKWLLQQAWFQERFSHLCAIIAAAHAPAETPEHNLMQAEYLEESKRLWLANLVLGPDWRQKWHEAHLSNTKVVELHSARVSHPQYKLKYEFKDTLTVSEPKFEVEGADVHFHITAPLFSLSAREYSDVPHFIFDLPYPTTIRVELKPSISDDYPAVLRQALASKCNVVVSKFCHSASVPTHSMIQIFRSRGILLVSEF